MYVLSFDVLIVIWKKFPLPIHRDTADKTALPTAALLSWSHVHTKLHHTKKFELTPTRIQI